MNCFLDFCNQNCTVCYRDRRLLWFRKCTTFFAQVVDFCVPYLLE